MKKQSMQLYRPEVSVDPEGRAERTFTLAGQLKGTLLPVRSELAAREFGLDENISFRLFCKTELSIGSGDVIRFAGEDYTVVHMAEYGRMKVVHLNTYIGTNGARTISQSLRY